MFTRPLKGPSNAVYWHLLQTYAAAEVAFNRYVALFPRESWPYLWAKKPNESEKTVFLTGGRQVHFKSGHKLQDLRVETLHGAIIDECRQQKAQLWTEIVRPMLGRFEGWCDFYSTPNGYDWVYDLYKAAENNPEWARFHAPSTEAWWWTLNEIESAKREMTEPVFAQEILAEFRSLASGKVYYAFGPHNLSEKCPWYDHRPWSPYHPAVIALDFNISPMSWTIGQCVNQFFWWFDEIHLNDSNTAEAAQALAIKILTMREQGHNPVDYDCVIIGDASGNARSTKSHESDYAILAQVLKSHGIKYRNVTPAVNPSIKDRVNAVNSRLKAASGEVSTWIHPTGCKWLVHDLERTLWKQGADFILDPGPKRDLTHASDGIGYAVAHFAPVKVVSGKSTMKVLSRSV